jgi:hypothetical protein
MFLHSALQVLDPCPPEIARLCYLMPTPEHRGEGWFMVLGGIAVIVFCALLNVHVMGELGDEPFEEKKATLSGFSPEFLTLTWIAIRIAYVWCGIGVLIGVVKIVTNK